MVLKRYAAYCAVGMLVACGVPKPRSPAAPYGLTTDSAAVPTGAGVYRVDPAQSEVLLLIHRAGAMARLGHNHVIVNRAIDGWVKYSGDATAASFSLRVPVAAFSIDDPALRGEAGPDFTAEVSDDAKAGTRHNMLSPALLDAEHFPTIILRSVAVTRSAGMLRAMMRVTVAGRDSTLVVPFMVDSGSRRLSATGTVTLRQSALGLVPFSVMLGALQVQDEFTVNFKIVAEAS